MDDPSKAPLIYCIFWAEKELHKDKVIPCHTEYTLCSVGIVERERRNIMQRYPTTMYSPGMVS